MKNLLLSLVAILSVAAFTGCKTSSDNNQPDQSEFDTLLSTYNSMFGVQGNLPSVMSYMIQTGIKYDSSLTLDTLIIKDYYETEEISALICGAYSADALYHRSFGNIEAAFESYTAAQIMANHLEIGPFYVENLLKKMEHGIVEGDSLLIKFNDILAKVDTNLSEEKRFRIVSSYLIGNIIEKMYLIDKGIQTLEGQKISEISEEAKHLYRMLLTEKQSIDLFVAMIDKYAVNNSGLLAVEIKTLQTQYDNLYNKGNHIYNTDDTFVRTQELINISDQIEQTRNLFVLH